MRQVNNSHYLTVRPSPSRSSRQAPGTAPWPGPRRKPQRKLEVPELMPTGGIGGGAHNPTRLLYCRDAMTAAVLPCRHEIHHLRLGKGHHHTPGPPYPAIYTAQADHQSSWLHRLLQQRFSFISILAGAAFLLSAGTAVRPRIEHQFGQWRVETLGWQLYLCGNTGTRYCRVP